MDPNLPIRPYISELSEEVIPNVNSWSELFCEKVPWPETWQVNKLSEKDVQVSAASGGVSTRNFSVKSTFREVPVESYNTHSSNGNIMAVHASHHHKGKRGRATVPPQQVIPQLKHFRPPSSDVSITGESSSQSQTVGSRYGYCDPVSGEIEMYEADGTPRLQTHSMRAVFTHEVSMDDKPQSAVKLFTGIPIPRSPGMSKLSRYIYTALNYTIHYIGIQHVNPVKIKVASYQELSVVTQKFQCKWSYPKGPYPQICTVFTVTNTTLLQRWEAYKRTLCYQKVEEYYHGTELACDITNNQALCTNRKCGICGISTSGFDTQQIGTNIKFRRFGCGFYLAPNSSKCHEYTSSVNGCRAVLFCDVCPGMKY